MNFSEIKTVFDKEIRDILRDRRTLLLMIILPLISYPMVLLGAAKAFTARQQATETKIVKLGFVNDDGTLRKYLAGKGPFEFITIGEDDPNKALEHDRVDVLVELAPDFQQRLDTSGEAPLLTIRTKNEHDSKDSVTRIDHALREFRADCTDRRLRALGLADPWQRAIHLTSKNVASSQMRSGSWIGLSLPTVLVMLIIVATTYPAFDMVTGERERGTLPILMVAPISRHNLMYGKLLAICTVGMTTALLLILSLFITLHFGATRVTDVSGTFTFNLPVIGALLTFPLAVPLVIFLAAVGLSLSAYSQNLQQGQGYLVPLITLVIPLTGVTFIPSQSLPPAVNLVPVANVCACLRDLLKGSYNWASIVTTFVSSCLYAYVLARYAISMLDKEERLFGIQVSPYRRTDFTRIVGAFYAGGFLLLFSLGQMFQSFDPIFGMMASQILLVLLPSIALVHWLKQPLNQTLSLMRPHLYGVLGAVLLAPGGLVLSGALVALQEHILPMPESYAKALMNIVLPKGRPVWEIVLAMAVTPGICEEVMFRGTVLGLLRKSMTPVRAGIACGIMFGCFHLSTYRLLPTSLIGIVFSFICLWTGSIFPSMALHATHNATTILAAVYGWNVVSLNWALPSVPCTALGIWLLSKSRQDLNLRTEAGPLVQFTQ